MERAEDGRQSGWLFVTGTAPRTGTTLMTWLLNLHPQVHLFCETLFPLALTSIFTPGYTHQPGRHLPEVAAQLGSVQAKQHGRLEGREDDAVQCARACCLALRSLREPVQWFGDKSPSYLESWRHLRVMFPECRLLVMDRRCDEVVASMRGCDWPWLNGRTDADLHEMVLDWRAQAEAIPDCCWVDLADLSAAPGEVIRRLLGWLDVDPAPYPWAEAVGQVTAPLRKVN